MFRFTLREMLLLTVIAAVGLGWWVHVRRLNSEARKVQSDLLTQADYVSQFFSVLTRLGCEIPQDSDPRCANGVPYTRVFVPQKLQLQTGCISFTLSGPRDELQRTLDGEFSEKYRAALGR
jgi:hypothetical protein